MILLKNLELVTSVSFYFFSKFISYLVFKVLPMYHEKRHNKLSSIPENNENVDDVEQNLWVPKKKHDVLKAKYKCLKKLFQIYDASVIGMLPQGLPEEPECVDEETPRRRRRRRSHQRTKTDACTSVINACAGETKVVKDSEINTDELALSDKNVSPRSVTSIQVETLARSLLRLPVKKDDKCVQDSNENIPQTSSSAAETDHKPHAAVSCHNFNEKRKSRFQIYIQRLFGLKSDSKHDCNSNYCQTCSKSDNNICSCNKKRKRKALKVTSPRRSRHGTSEMNLRDMDILSYVQTIQKQCLMDRTPRQCPFVNCKMMTYGIINYNDHLNLCHFPERKYICHYCHEGFKENKDKLIHENEHLGINRLASNLSNISKTENLIKSDKKVSVTQTDPGLSNEKILKIMSLIDKIPNSDILVEESKDSREIYQDTSDKEVMYDSGSCEKKTLSWPNFSGTNRGTKGLSKSASERSPRTTINSGFSCKMCGETFGNRRYLQFHVDVDHRDLHRTPPRTHKPLKFVSNDGKITIKDTCSDLTGLPSTSTLNDFKKRDTVSYDPSTNIIYYTSLESFDDKVSTNKVISESNDSCYKWESGTKIIRV